MSASQLPPDPPPSISVSELRRRLLASTPPLGGTATADLDAEAAKTGSGPISTEVLLRKLKMPAHTAAPPDAIAVNRRTPIGMSGALSADFLSEPPIGESPAAELHRLRSENREFRQLLNEMKNLLQEASDQEQTFAQQTQLAEQQLAEKQSLIEELTAQLQQIEDQINSGQLVQAQPQAPPKNRTELEEWSDELEQEAAALNQLRRQLDDERKQLHDDEESLEKQMRDMEVSMARERALMARQETELKRLSAEIQHELELMQRGDASLREQLQKFQRRAAEVMSPARSGATGFPKR